MEIFKYSNVGSREVNQDYVVSQSFGQDVSLHLVADGIGGYECGEIASKVVGDSYVDGLIRNMSLEESTALASANMVKECHNLGVSKMGSTVAGVLINKSEATVFWAGDSRVYIFRNHEVIYQTEDHSLVNELNMVRPLTFDERKKYAHVITRSIMGKADDHIDVYNTTLQSGDEILICTDGVYNDCPVDYLAESIRKGCFDIDKQNEKFDDNHSLIFITI